MTTAAVTDDAPGRSTCVRALLACCLLLALTVAACGDDERAASPAGPDEPVAQTAPGGVAPALPVAGARSCRRAGRRLVGLDQASAMSLAERRGCTMRIAVQDGVHLALTEDYQPARINVRVRRGVVAGVVFMG